MDGKPVMDSYTYLASAWATPQIEIDGIAYDCFVPRSESNGWDSDTKWPQSALGILMVNLTPKRISDSGCLLLKASKNNDTH